MGTRRRHAPVYEPGKRGVNIKFDTFKNDSWHFHNALARANYRNSVKNIDFTAAREAAVFLSKILGSE